MDPVQSQPLHQVRPVIEDHRHAARLGDGRDHGRRRRDGGLVRRLQPDLQTGHVVRVQRRLQIGHEGGKVRDRRRGQQVEAAGGVWHGPGMRAPAVGVNPPVIRAGRN